MSQRRILISDVAAIGAMVRKRAVKLYVMLADRTRGGTERGYFTEAFLTAELGCSEATFHRARRELEGVGLAVVERRRVGPRSNRSSLWRLLKPGAAQVQAAMQAAMVRLRAARAMALQRMGVKNDTQNPFAFNLDKSRVRETANAASRQRQSPLYRQLMSAGLKVRRE